MRWVSVLISISLTFVLSVVAYSAKLDEFNGPELSKIWTLRDPAKNSTISFSNGKLVMKLKANSDMWIKGVDAGVMLLTDPPKLDNYSIELVENPAVGVSNRQVVMLALSSSMRQSGHIVLGVHIMQVKISVLKTVSVQTTDGETKQR